MSEITATIDQEENTLTIVLPLAPGSPLSRSGKSRTVASTFGNQVVDIENDEPITVGVNAYRKISK